MEIYKLLNFFPSELQFFPTATCVIIKIDDIIEEMNIKNNSLCTKHIVWASWDKRRAPLSSGGSGLHFRLNLLPFRAVYYFK